MSVSPESVSIEFAVTLVLQLQTRLWRTSRIGGENIFKSPPFSVVIPFGERLTEGVGSRFREACFPRSKRVGGNDSRPHPRWFITNGVATPFNF